ncbi:FG-GAP repeat domain-containing protein [Paraliomyxa miuraensis]|uniref:FG-GAP repeat domain-containing protein n=1 Tax=Paraliomyxa miuraensis TaxID=376150 RepID=UPI00225BF117|nr:FG-GAP-like repeat-containing protein [Paraliomyxa miuraensis]MCX4242171.1 FG-GAP-like repeat-containing protein [Paraliomyxa miuraensis]
MSRSRMQRRHGWLAMVGCLGVATCSDPEADDGTPPITTLGPGPGSTDTASTGPDEPTSAGTMADTDGASGTADETGSVPKFDMGQLPDVPGTMPPSCEVVDDMNAVGDCMQTAPPDSFEPDVQWQWMGEGDEIYVVVTPLVANLTDDDGNGTIDLCDVPDIVAVAWATLGGPAHIHVLDGATGALHFTIPTLVDFSVAPALGDIDGDGLPEIISANSTGNLLAFEHDGTLKWQSASAWPGYYIGAIALADMDNDGDVEIVAGNQLHDHQGNLLWTAPQSAGANSATAAADLDGDGDLEMVLGHAAIRNDGTLLWNSGIGPGYPQIADLDDDGLPEVLVTNANGLALLEHDGAVTYQGLRPTGAPAGGLTWLRPATIHDFDGDGRAEYAVSSGNQYSVYEADASILWSAPVLDGSGVAAGTAFDFLGDGDAEAMYADETFLFVFDAMGNVLLQTPRTSRTGTEYPVVADVDNDGSAEIVVVSNEPISGGGATAPAVQVIRDVQDRWIQARRIWNQHTYHVTNVREDGTIPQFEPPSWESLNTFRTNAQIEGGGVCIPDPAG